MGKLTWRIWVAQKILPLLMIGVLVMGSWGCRDRNSTPTRLLSEPSATPNTLIGQLAEVSPPDTIQQLRPYLDSYQPQVKILSPRAEQVLQDTTVSVRLQVRDLPTFQNPDWGLGPYLQVFLDERPYQAVYDPDQTLTFTDLTPGSHTLRVLAARPWHESFKNAGAFAQTTFHIYARTAAHEPDTNLPQITYSNPQGHYGAEPIMLDFFLANAPLHMVAQTEDGIQDWRVRCTVNGQSFVFDQWQPIYLKGFKPGKNWVQLELIDETGTPLLNAFNNTVRLIDYQPGGTDPLSQLIRGDISVDQARVIVDPTYIYTPPESEPELSADEQGEPADSQDTEPPVSGESTPSLEPSAPEAVDKQSVQLSPDQEDGSTPSASDANSVEAKSSDSSALSADESGVEIVPESVPSSDGESSIPVGDDPGIQTELKTNSPKENLSSEVTPSEVTPSEVTTNEPALETLGEASPTDSSLEQDSLTPTSAADQATSPTDSDIPQSEKSGAPEAKSLERQVPTTVPPDEIDPSQSLESSEPSSNAYGNRLDTIPSAAPTERDSVGEVSPQGAITDESSASPEELESEVDTENPMASSPEETPPATPEVTSTFVKLRDQLTQQADKRLQQLRQRFQPDDRQP